MSTQDKYEQLLDYLKGLKTAAIAFSSGVDSTLLLKAAKKALGAENIIAVTAKSHSFPGRERNEATDFCKQEGIRHIIIETNELEIEGFCENPKDRCYICKKALFEQFIKVAEEYGMAAVCEGSNMDDLGDYRPGLVAVKELGVKSPLREAGLTKVEIREISKQLSLPTWNKASFACLATRFVYGEYITAEKLAMVDKGEQLLFDMGFTQFRVRIHGDMARIEVPAEDIMRLMKDENRQKIASAFKSYGFSYVSVDMQGYRTGSMNETLTEEERKYQNNR